MPFNAKSYRANRDERLAFRYLDDARDAKRAGEPAARVANLAALARLTLRSARLWRAMAEAGRSGGR